MAIDPVTGSLIAGGLSQGFNALTQIGANAAARRYNTEMYERQKRDNEAFWHMQNQYNSPQAQMQRLSEAGLNPNLVYGASAPGNSSGQIHTASPGSWQPKAPQFDAGSVMDAYFNVATKSAQLDNIRAMNDKIVAETEIALVTAGLKKSELDYSSEYFGSRARSLSIDREIKGLDRDLKFSLQNPNDTLAHNPDLRNSPAYKAAEEKILQLYIDTQIKRDIQSGKSLDNMLKGLELQLQKNGLSAKDPAIIRIIGRLIGQYVDLSTFKFK